MKTAAGGGSSRSRVACKWGLNGYSEPVHRAATTLYPRGGRHRRWTMSNSPMAFDPIGTVVDWIDACRQRSLAALVDLYDEAAKVDCCEGGSFRGKSGVERYWLPKLKKPVPGAFAVDALLPEAGGVSLDYRDYDGRPVRTHFRFSETGKSSAPPARRPNHTARIRVATANAEPRRVSGRPAPTRTCPRCRKPGPVCTVTHPAASRSAE